MRVLILEEVEKHATKFYGGGGIATSLALIVGEALHQEVEIAKSLAEADRKLREKNFDWTIIHHSGYEEVDFLKKRNPNVKYAAISGNVYSLGKLLPGSIGEAWVIDMKKHYDHILFNMHTCLEEMLGIKG